jgi:hypothetical protein
MGLVAFGAGFYNFGILVLKFCCGGMSCAFDDGKWIHWI